MEEGRRKIMDVKALGLLEKNKVLKHDFFLSEKVKWALNFMGFRFGSNELTRVLSLYHRLSSACTISRPYSEKQSYKSRVN